MRKFIVFYVVSFFILNSCAKDGSGGAATIEGKIMERLIKQSSSGSLDTLAFYEAQDKRVFIIYGDNNSIDDDTRTSFNGNYKFDFLYKGNYSVFAYSECLFLVNECPSEQLEVLEQIEISKSRGIHTAPTIIIDNFID